MPETDGMGKTEFYRIAAEELREAGWERVMEELAGDLKGRRGVRPADNGMLVIAILLRLGVNARCAEK